MMKKLKKQFGGSVTAQLKDDYARSIHWKNDKFENLEETNMSLSFWEIPELLYKQFCMKNDRIPKNDISLIPFDNEAFLKDGEKAKFAWYGHSALILRTGGKTILIDPMLGSNASPIAPYKTSRFTKGTLDVIDDFPEIDILLLSHDHYDHLDYDSIQKLKGKVGQYYVALGIKRHLVEWGIEANLIVEFDWWQSDTVDDLEITFTPSRHFSGRGIRDRSQSLWGGWVIRSSHAKIWFSGDGGYGAHFKEIANRLGPFDFGFMECGQYNEKWRPIHMFPEESVQAALDGQVAMAMPVHWAGFTLAQHSWTEPAEIFYQTALEKGLKTVFPKIGEVISIDADTDTHCWWREMS